MSNLKHFDWPHLQMYISLFTVSLWEKITDIYVSVMRTSVSASSSILIERPASFFLAIRFVSFLMSSLSLIIFYKGVKEFLGKNIAIVSLIFFTLSVQNIEDAHLATLESGVTFWVVLTFFFSQRIFRTGKSLNYLLAGLFAGFSVSTKYNGALVTLLILSAHISYAVANNISAWRVVLSKKLLLSAASSILGFFVGTPYALLDFKNFIRTDSAVGALWQFHRQKAPLYRTIFNFDLLETRFKSEIFRSLGFLGPILVLLGSYLSLKKLKNRAVVILLFPALYFWYVGSFKLFYSQYFNLLFPFLAILVGIGMIGLIKIIRDFMKNSFLLTPVMILILFLSAVSQIIQIVKMDYVFAMGDNRVVAEKWISENVKAGSKIGVSGAYGAKLDDFDGTSGFNAVKIDELFREMDTEFGHDAQIYYFRNVGINLVVTGDYNLDARLKSDFPANCRYPDGDSWAIDTLQKIKVFYPRSYVEPTVAVLGLDNYDNLIKMGVLK